MTQFLLARGTKRPNVDACAVESAAGTDFLEDAASRIFKTTRCVWVVRPQNDEKVCLVNEAYDQLLDGDAIKNTRLGALVRALLSDTDEFAFYYANDCDDLPIESDVLAFLQHELSVPRGTPELYLRWEAPNHSPGADVRILTRPPLIWNVKKFRLRPTKEIFTKLDQFYRAHWYARNNQLIGKSDTVANIDVILERRKALEWVCNQNVNWDQISLDT